MCFTRLTELCNEIIAYILIWFRLYTRNINISHGLVWSSLPSLKQGGDKIVTTWKTKVELKIWLSGKNLPGIFEGLDSITSIPHRVTNANTHTYNHTFRHTYTYTFIHICTHTIHIYIYNTNTHIHLTLARNIQIVTQSCLWIIMGH